MLLAVVALALSCGRGAGDKPSAAGTPGAAPAPKPAAAPRTFQVKGVVREVKATQKKVKIAHEEIPGYMEAMTMDFDVRRAEELNGLRPGDTVSFRMVVTEDDGWIEEVLRLDVAPVPAPIEPSSLRRVREVEPLSVGDKMPDYSFTNTLGRVTKLSEFKGQALVFNFIFTRCPFPTFCPRQSSNFSETQAKLKARAGGPTNWHLLSITIDPEWDTPERLAAYAKQYHADPERWNFLTGDLIDITAIGEQFGLQFWRPTPKELPNHNVRTVVVDAAGRIQWVTRENEWKADELVEQVLKAAAVKPPVP